MGESALAGPTELLERDQELERVDALLKDVGRQAGRVLVIEGPPGIGKSRLVEAGRARATDLGVHVLSARATELEQRFPFGVVRQLFERTLVEAEAGERNRWLEGAASLAADVHRFSADDQTSGAADTLAPLLTSQVTLRGGDRPVEVVARTLAKALHADSMLQVAVAARTVEALRLFDRQIAEALFTAQERDATEYGWTTIRALQTMIAAASRSPAGPYPADVASARATLPAQDARLLESVRVRTAAARPEPTRGPRSC